MKKTLILASILMSSIAGNVMAQSAVDAFTLSRNDFRGTARFMSMGGAFGALGADLSTLNQNPAGIGVYRSSEIGVTVALDLLGSTTNDMGYKQTDRMTKFNCNNFGYVGALYTGSDVMPYFQFGATYTRAASFNRRFSGSFGAINGSYSNYIAGVTSANPQNNYPGFSQSELASASKYNPYIDGPAPWMSILAYNSYLINPETDANGNFINNETNPRYKGLWQDGISEGDALYSVQEQGYTDEYAINFGGNFLDIVYWGMGFGITDITYTATSYYDEAIDNALIPNYEATGAVTGAAQYGMDSWKHVTGTGFNYKIGVIVKPIPELRLGFAVHTPTYYNLTQQSWAQVNYNYSTGYKNQSAETNDGWNYEIDWKMRTPWRMMFSAATVLGGRFILSADYEYRPNQNISIRTANNDPYVYMNSDVKDYYQSSNIIRVGTEYRITPRWSVRAGFNYESTPTTEYALSGQNTIYTEGPEDCGTMPSFTMSRATTHITAGIGYKYNSFYIDAAYVYRHRSSDYQPYTTNQYTDVNWSEVKDNDSSIVLSLGFKF